QCGAEGNRRRLVTGAAWRSWSLVTACAVWYYARCRLARRPNSNEAGATVGQRQWQQSACKYRGSFAKASNAADRLPKAQPDATTINANGRRSPLPNGFDASPHNP